MSPWVRRLLLGLELLCLALWTGSLFGFAFFTAPTVFSVVGSPSVAGRVTGLVLGNLDFLALALTLVILVSQFLRRGGARWHQWLRAAGVLAMLTLTLYAHFGVVGQMNALQARMDRPIEQYAVTDPLRAAYDRYHERSRGVYGGVLLLGMALLVAAPLQNAGRDEAG